MFEPTAIKKWSELTDAQRASMEAEGSGEAEWEIVAKARLLAEKTHGPCEPCPSMPSKPRPGADCAQPPAPVQGRSCKRCGNLSQGLGCARCEWPASADDGPFDTPRITQAMSEPFECVACGHGRQKEVYECACLTEPSELPSVAETQEANQASFSDDDTNLRILTAAPAVFRNARSANGVAAIVYGHIEKRKLFRTVGFTSAQEFAREHLDLSTDMAKKLSMAAKAMWAYFPEEACSVITHLAAGAMPGDRMLSALPSQSHLVLVGRLAKRLDPGECTAIVQRVREGCVTTNELEQKIRDQQRRTQLPREANECAGFVAPTSSTGESSAGSEIKHAPVARQAPMSISEDSSKGLAAIPSGSLQGDPAGAAAPGTMKDFENMLEQSLTRLTEAHRLYSKCNSTELTQEAVKRIKVNASALVFAAKFFLSIEATDNQKAP